MQFKLCIWHDLASIQVFYNKSSEIKYARARHYSGQVNGKPQFAYHQQSLEYVQRKINETPEEKDSRISNKLGHVGQAINVDQNKTENGSYQENSWGCRLAWSRLVDLGSIDSGSNPGSPILNSNPFPVTLLEI